MRLAALKAGFLFLGGLALCAGGLWFALGHADLVRNGARADGVVIELSIQTVRGSKLYHPVVRYVPAGQGPTRFRERTGLWTTLFEVGEAVTVLYFYDAPTEAKIESFWTLWFLPLVMGLFGIACIMAGRHTFKQKPPSAPR